MNKFEQNFEKIRFSDRVEEIALEASQMPEFQKAVKDAKNYIEAMKTVRELLQERFPEISDLPEPQGRGTLPGNEFYIAKHILGLLWEK